MRFENWEFPDIKDGELTRYNWLVRHPQRLSLGYKTDIGAFSYINAEYEVLIEDDVIGYIAPYIRSQQSIIKRSGHIKEKLQNWDAFCGDARCHHWKTQSLEFLVL